MSDTERFPVPFGCYVKPSGAIAAYPMIQVLPDPSLSGKAVRFEQEAIFIPLEEFTRRLVTARRLRQ